FSLLLIRIAVSQAWSRETPWSIGFTPECAVRVLPLDGQCDAHAAADAQRGDALPGVAALHLVQQRHQNAAAGRADRVPDRDRPAVDVHLAGVPAHLVVDGT